MKQVAWFTPLLPIYSDIAKHNAELLPLLAKTHRIDVFFLSVDFEKLMGKCAVEMQYFSIFCPFCYFESY